MSLQDKLKAMLQTKTEEQEKFLQDNAAKEGVITLPSGLQYLILKTGDGEKPGPATMVTVHYEGSLINGNIFDSSYKRGQPATFGVHQVIRGWTEALQLMPVGSKWRLFIPSSLGYGARGAGGSIPPHATLVFDVELLSMR
jgi:FKBP-type peptidyl-prolyl cis-trans isomerase FklB